MESTGMDLVDKEKAVRAFRGGVFRRVARHFKAWVVVFAALGLSYAIYVATGYVAIAQSAGTVRVHRLGAPATIRRDSRGIPYIEAASERDAFFAEGFAQASDRLFQMDLVRRYVYGQLSEVLGPIQLPSDEQLRAFDVRGAAQREWTHLSTRNRNALQAFSDGANAAIHAQPLPLEFRLLLYRPRDWDPRDSLAVALAISLSVGDTPANVLARDALWHSTTPAQYTRLLPLSDKRYDTFGSNAWASGAAHNSRRRALIANDPHLTPEIPGIWYAIEMRAAGFHVAGVTIPGIPGVILGHNDRIAWATTNAMASMLSVFHTGAVVLNRCRIERFRVRLAPDRTLRYCGTRGDFELFPRPPQGSVLVRWMPYSDSRSALTTVFALDRAASLREALGALRAYAGPPQNFILAGSNGRVAYHLAGPIPDDPAWGRYVHPATDVSKTYPAIPFEALPQSAPSRTLIAISANNKMYGRGYPYRIAPMFAPPYRAYRIAQLLRERRSYDTHYFERMQLDAVSPADAEFAHRLATYARTHSGFLSPAQSAELLGWDGDYAPESTAATLEQQLRSAAEDAAPSPYSVFGALRSRNPPESMIDALRAAAQFARRATWSQAGSIPSRHPFGPIGFPFLNGASLPGDGDEYTIHVQTADLSQSFRSVWEPGAWDSGGLSIPEGESGEQGSPHYDDQHDAWVRGQLQPLPFSGNAIRRATRSQLLLVPAR